MDEKLQNLEVSTLATYLAIIRESKKRGTFPELKADTKEIAELVNGSFLLGLSKTDLISQIKQEMV